MRVTIDPNARLLSVVPKGTYVAVVAQMGDFWGVLMANNTVGWTPKTAIELIDYQTEVSAPTDPASSQATPSAAGSATGYLNGQLQNMDPRTVGALREAFSYLGVPYVWGGEGRSGLDCSAFVRNVFATQGVRLPRHSGDQVAVGREVQGPDLRAGDRLYFDCSARRTGIDHTGIYLGNGLFIHASGGKRQVTVDSLFKPLYYNGLVAARRDFE
jgi:cell wall-associated NlpC family hydrolase